MYVYIRFWPTLNMFHTRNVSDQAVLAKLAGNQYPPRA